MKQSKQMYSYTKLYIPIAALVMLLVFSCSKDSNGPRYDNPSISLGIDDVIDAKVGTRVSVPINFNAGGGAKSVVVFRNGGFLTEINVDANANQYTYETEALPGSLTEGEELEYGFLISNLDGTDSETVNLTIRAELYDKVTIGSETLYELDFPSDGIISGGTIVKMIQGRNYYLNRSVNFDVGSEVHIDEGVHVYMDAEAAEPIEFVINGEANIVGTSSTPVVFTSSKTLLPSGDPQAGDWGLFRMNGTGSGSDNGTVNYLRIEYAGDRAFRLVGVGSGTNLSHIQVFKSTTEGVMITGGDARLKYVVATDCEGGSYRLGDDYEGEMQFVIAVSSEQYADNDDFSIRDQAKPILANLTLLGPGQELSNTHGIRIRGTAEPKMYNTIVAQYPRRGVRVNEDDVDNNVPVTDLNGPTVFAYSHVFDLNSQLFREKGEAFAPGATPDFHNSTDAIAGIGVADFVPDAEQSSTFDPSTLDAFFTDAPFVGAVRNDANDWTKGWVKNPDGSVR